MKFLFKVEDTDIGFKKPQEFIEKYQDPREADKLLKLETTLQEVQTVMHKTMEDVNFVNNEVDEKRGFSAISNGKESRYKYNFNAILQESSTGKQEMLCSVLIS